MPADIGNQVITVKFFDPVDSYIANAIAIGVRKVGIYSGGYLAKTNDTTVTISTFDCEISDGTYQVRAVTGSTVSVTVGAGTQYVVLRWIYTGSATADYVDFLGVGIGSILPTDIIVGKCNFAGATLTGFDYSTRTTPFVFDLFLKVQPTVPASLYVKIRPGRVCYGTANFDIIEQDSPLLVAPGSNSWIAVIQVSTTGSLQPDGTYRGVITVAYGASAASPVPPSYNGLITLAEITIAAGATQIIAANIKDVRDMVSSGTSLNNLLPLQVGNAGKCLNTDGTNALWDYATYAP